MRPQKWTFRVIFLLDCLIWPLDVLIWPLLWNWMVSIFTQYEVNRMAAWGSLMHPLIIAGSLVIYVEVASRTMGFLMARSLPNLQENIRMKMFDHVQHHSPRYFSERLAGSLANKITDMTTQVEALLQQLFWPIIPMIATCFLGIGFLWFVNPIFSGLLLFWTAIHLGIAFKFTGKIDLYEHEHGEIRSTLLGKIVDSFTNNFAVNLFYRFSQEKHMISPTQTKEKNTNVRARNYIEKMRCFFSFFYFLAVFLLMFGTMIYLWLHNQISTGQVIQVFTTMWGFANVLWAVGSALPIVFQSFGTMKQAYSVMQDPKDLGDTPTAKHLKITSGEIIFDQVYFHYGQKDLFVNKNVHIQGGEKVGLVGYTGAGKSSFVNLILRFFALHSGSIRIDGQDIKEVTLKSLREQIAMIPQDPVLFHRTLKENICFGNPQATNEEMIRAAKLAHCDEFIKKIPLGYQALVGERGTKLSGG